MSAKLCGNVRIRFGRLLRKGDSVETHAHKWPHMTYLPKGRALVERLTGPGGAVVKSVEKDPARGNNWVLIPAGVWHRITALDDDTIYHCIYSLRDETGAATEEVSLHDGWEHDYA